MNNVISNSLKTSFLSVAAAITLFALPSTSSAQISTAEPAGQVSAIRATTIPALYARSCAAFCNVLENSIEMDWYMFPTMDVWIRPYYSDLVSINTRDVNVCLAKVRRDVCAYRHFEHLARGGHGAYFRCNEVGVILTDNGVETSRSIIDCP